MILDSSILYHLAGHFAVQNQPERNPAPAADTKDVLVMVIAKVLDSSILYHLAGHFAVHNQSERNPAPAADTKDVLVMVIAKILMLPK